MAIRTDLEYKDGDLYAKDDGSRADVREKLPEVQFTDRLASDRWGESLKSEAGEHADDPALKDAEAAHTTLAQGVRRLAEARDNQDPAHTQAQHLEEIQRSYDRFTKMAGASMDRARNTVKERLNKVEKEFRERAGFSDRGTASEIRQVVRGMDDQSKNEFIANAIESNDGEALAAILDAHPSLSGLDHDRLASYRTRAMGKITPDLLKLERSLKRADQLLIDSYTDTLEIGDKVTAKEVRERHAAAAQKAKDARSRAESAWNG